MADTRGHAQEYRSHVPEHQVVAYGADNKSARVNIGLFLGVACAIAAVIIAIGWYGGTAHVQANNPSVETDGVSATVPGAGSAGKDRPGGNWDTRFNR